MFFLLLCFNSLGAALTHARENPIHLQVQHIRASDSDFYQSLLFYYDQSEENTYANAVSIGWETGKQLFGWPAEMSFHVGFQKFDERGYQPDSYGITGFSKVSKLFMLPNTQIPLRAGFGLGLSYVSRIPVAEKRDFEPDKSSKLTVYIDYTLQFSIKEFLVDGPLGFSGGGAHTLKDVYLGYSIVHRSTAYGLFADTGGGINYMGIGLELVFD